MVLVVIVKECFGALLRELDQGLECRLSLTTLIGHDAHEPHQTK